MESATQKIVETGILGALLVAVCTIAGFVIRYLFKLYVAERDKNEVLLKDSLQRDDKHLATIKEFIDFAKGK
jgi:hypothetical protein